MDRSDLHKITETARTVYISSAKSIYESSEQHLARCWIVAIETVLKIDLNLPPLQENYYEPED